MIELHDTSRSVLALGFFDGVHLGHGALLQCVCRRAREKDAVPGAVTFDAHPSALISGQSVPLLTTPEERADIMKRQYGIERVIVAHFDEAMMRMPWRDFLTGYLFRMCGAVHLVSGPDYRFGYRGEGDPDRLRDTCREYGVGCDIVPPVELDGVPVSSTYIRKLISAGDLERAKRFLGHPYCMTGPVVHGHRLGSTLGFPTVNLRLPEGILVPPLGVYAARVCLPDGRAFPAVANIGVRPTVSTCDGTVSIEAFLLDFSGDLYGESLRLDLYRHLRAERKFDSLEDLRAAVMHDAEIARAYFT